MSTRINIFDKSQKHFKSFSNFSTELRKSSIEESVRNLVEIRASQLNGCAFCLDMHVKEATIRGERPLRLHHLVTWRDSNLFAPRERAALAWTEVLTQLPPGGVPDEIYARVRTQFTEQELIELTYIVMSINGWNRINIAFKSEPGAQDALLGLARSGLA